MIKALELFFFLGVSSTSGYYAFHSKARPSSVVLQQARNDPALQVVENEFQRKFSPDRVIRSKRDFSVSISAEASECDALAARFDLSHIENLKATLSLRPELIGSRAGSTGVQVEGVVSANVTQRCVRTNEDFPVHLEFPLYSIVRPVVPRLSVGQLEDSSDSFQPRRSGKKSSYRPQDRNLNEMDMLEMQRMLQSDISNEDDVLMEDESIYPTDGSLDVGELVAQLFWLELDPYPKKPGTGPIQKSISG